MIMKELKHPYVVKYIDGFEDPDYLWIVLEYVDGGDLLDFIQRKKGLGKRDAVPVKSLVAVEMGANMLTCGTLQTKVKQQRSRT